MNIADIMTRMDGSCVHTVRGKAMAYTSRPTRWAFEYLAKNIIPALDLLFGLNRSLAVEALKARHRA